jgi:hypothetical protein
MCRMSHSAFFAKPLTEVNINPFKKETPQRNENLQYVVSRVLEHYVSAMEVCYHWL